MAVRDRISRKSLAVWLIRLALPFAGWMLLAALWGLATVGSGIGLLGASAWIISAAALHPSIADLQVAIVGVRFFGVARGVFRYLERYVSHQVTFRLLARLRVWFYEALEPLAPARLLQYRSGDVLARAIADIETLQYFYVRVIAPPLVAALAALLIGAFLGRSSPGLAGAILGIFLLGGVGAPLLTRCLARDAGRRVVALRADLHAAVADGVHGMAELVAFGREIDQARRVRELSQELAACQARLASVSGLQAALEGLLTSLAALLVLALATPLVTAGKLDGVNLGTLALAAMASVEAILPLPLAAQMLDSAIESAGRLREIVQTVPAVADPPQPLALSFPALGAFCPGGEFVGAGARPTPGQGRALPLQQDGPGEHASCASLLSIASLSFRYAPSEPLALDDLSFTLAPGRSLAIVGPSGAGKSTLVHLLLRFWDYSQGRIQLCGRELRECRQEDVRRLMAVVAQSTYLFSGTVRHNLALASPGAAQADIEQAAQAAHIHTFIQSLPQGYDTWIGEGGVRLSGGERQRLAIARALVQNAPLLILDEATANLDPVTERDVMETVRLVMRGRTTLLITHRLPGLAECTDEILVLDGGRAVERGRHADLVQAGGLYQRMWTVQNSLIQTI